MAKSSKPPENSVASSQKAAARAKTRGRRQDSGLTEAILQAAAEILLEAGFDGFRVQAVAKRAGCGNGAIYRRWPTKENLVASAIRNLPPGDLPETDDAVSDMRRLVLHECTRAVEHPDRVPGLISAMRSDEGIREAALSVYPIGTWRRVIGRVVGEDHPQLVVLAELAPALCLLRSCFCPVGVEPEALTEEIVALICGQLPEGK